MILFGPEKEGSKGKKEGEYRVVELKMLVTQKNRQSKGDG
jgi:hypothetical protein